ncbi:MAG: fumarate hydratase [Methanomassiliicoccales archaeon]
MTMSDSIPHLALPLELVERVTVNLFRIAVTTLPRDVVDALEGAARQEGDQVGRTQLEAILENVRVAEKEDVPICQDTGVPLVFLRGHCESMVEEGVRRGVEAATEEIPLRPNVVSPLDRENPGNNLGEGLPHIHWEPTEEEFIELTVMPKGAGSENMSRLGMLKPSEGLEGIKSFVLDAVVEAGGKPCPPTIVGVGIGGTADLAAHMAKEALLRPLDSRNPDPRLAEFEEEMKAALNRTGIGPMGLGGETTVLGVRAKAASCHTASLPVAVCFQCWAARRASARISQEGTVIYCREGFR